jgi:MraZ protein
LRFFSSNSTHKIDAKGRVSIPANFRKVLEREGGAEVVLIPRMKNEPAIEGLGATRFEELAAAVDRMNPLDPAAIALSNKLLGQSRTIQLEDTGRIVLSAELRETAGLKEQALFVGLGRSFQIWNPETYASRQPRMDAFAMQNFHRLPWGGAPAQPAQAGDPFAPEEA